MTSTIQLIAAVSAAPLATESTRTAYRVGYIEGARDLLEIAEKALDAMARDEGTKSEMFDGAVQLVKALRGLFRDNDREGEGE